MRVKSSVKPKGFTAPFKSLLALEGTPQAKAKAFAIGVFIAFTPTYGLHTATAILASWIFGLPFSIILLGSLVNNPWTFFPIYGASYIIGELILSIFPQCYSPTPFCILAHRLKSLSWREWFSQAPLLILKEGIPLIVGSLFLGVILALLTYVVVLRMLKFREIEQEGSHEQHTKEPD